MNTCTCDTRELHPASECVASGETATDIQQRDVAALLNALDLGDHARPYSMHAVIHRDILPAIRARKPKPLEAPTEPGTVAFEIEVMPHDWANDGMGWHKGRGTPAHVAQTLRDYADQVEFFKGPNDVRRTLTDEEAAAEIAKHFKHSNKGQA